MTQRVIKFRAWHNEAKAMLQVGDNHGTTHPLDCAVYARQGQDVVLMLWTGLLDKHGKEIYEGDRLRGEFNKKGQRITKERYGTVVFAFGGFHVIYDDEPKSHYNMTYKYRFEVIGNIYSNPELVDPKMIEHGNS